MSSAMSPFDRAHTTSYSTPIENVRLSCTVFEILSKVVDFNQPHLHLAPPPVEFRGDFWREKIRLPGLSRGAVCLILCSSVLVEHRLVTDTDRHARTKSNGQSKK